MGSRHRVPSWSAGMVSRWNDHNGIEPGLEAGAVRWFFDVDVSAGTSCPRGGDAGHGGRTVVAIRASSGMAWVVRVERPDGQYEEVFQPAGIVLRADGDAEGAALGDALAWAAEVLRRQSRREDVPSLVRTVQRKSAPRLRREEPEPLREVPQPPTHRRKIAQITPSVRPKVVVPEEE